MVRSTYRKALGRSALSLQAQQADQNRLPDSMASVPRFATIFTRNAFKVYVCTSVFKRQLLNERISNRC